MYTCCIVIPFYNEEGRFPENEFHDFLSRDRETAFCLVNDGSNDFTGTMLESLRISYPERIILISLPRNCGKAEAVRCGMLAATKHFASEHFGFFDADLATPLDEYNRLRNHLNENQRVHYVFGSRVATLGVKINRTLFRHLTGRIIATLISNILNLVVYDTQCGAKIFTRSMAQRVFEKPFITQWLFDVEILARIIESEGRGNIENVATEIPINSWTDKGGSKIRWTYAFRVWLDLYRIRRYYRAVL